MLDLLIIGGGPIGIACGLEAKKKGLNYVILEKGCIVNSLYHYPANMQFFSSSERLEIDNIPFISKEAKPKKDEALEYYRRLVTTYDLNIRLFERVNEVEKKENDIFTIISDKNSYESKNVVVATGFYDIPNHLNIPGENLEKVTHYYHNPHYYATRKVAVVGASNSAIDAALECWRKGAEVSLIIRGPEVGRRVKYWVRPDIMNRIDEGSIKAYYNSEITQIHKNTIEICGPQGNFALANDFVIALTGYQPNFEFLERLGISLSKDEKRLPNYDPDTMETNVPGLYLAGVICGGMETHKWFIENSRIHAPIIMEHIKGKQAL